MKFDPLNPRDLGPPAAHVAMALALELRALGTELAAWGPVGERVERLAGAARGDGEGLTDADVRVLRLWAFRWSKLGPNLRAFYAEHAGEAWASAALWTVLDGRGRPFAAQHAQLHRAWRDSPHHVPGIDPLPRVPNA